MSMSKSEASRIAALEARVAALEAREIDDEIGADHADHVAAFPKKRGRPPKAPN